MAPDNELPKTMKALVLETTEKPPTVEIVPTPEPTIGSAVVRIIGSNVISYLREVYNGKRKYPFPMPLIVGSAAVGRVAAVGPDATKFKPGDLVLVDVTTRSRDDPTDVYLAGIMHGYTEGSQKLMREVYRDWTFAEYCRAPLENLTLFNEKRLFSSPSEGGLGYKVEQLSFLFTLGVPYGGLKDINLQAGETVIVAPATGGFGGAAVMAAQAMGARVIAMGRNRESLDWLRKRVSHPDRLEIVPITGNMEGDLAELKKYGPIDAYFDIGPGVAYNSTHIKSCIFSLRHGGRISLMGGYREDVAIPHSFIMHKNIRIFGKWMYERSDLVDLVKLVEGGMLDLSAGELVGAYPLEQWKEAWDAAAENAKFGQYVLMKP